MRALVVFVVCVAAATANPLMLKKSMNAKAIESVDQDLEVGQVNVDRSKKDVTFCVEVRSDNNKPMVVDCGNRQPVHFPVNYPVAPAQQPQPSAPSTPAPEPEPLPEPQPQPQPQPQQNVQTIVYPVGPVSPSGTQFTIVGPYSTNGQLSPNGQLVPIGPVSPNVQFLPTGPASPSVQFLPSGPASPNAQFVPNGPVSPSVQYLPSGPASPNAQFVPSGPASPSGSLSPGSPGSSGAPGTGLTGPHTTTLNIEVPCQQEMAAYVVQPPQELYLAPTGNCVPQIPPNLIQTAPANQAPAQVLHLPTGQHGLHGLKPHQHASHGVHIKPVHHHVAPAPVPAISIVPASSSAALPSALPVHYHNGVQCTCNGTPGLIVAGRSADTMTQAQSNEELAKKFLQDLQMNMMPKSEPAQASPALQTQYVASTPTISVQPQTISVQPQTMSIQPQTMSIQPQSMTVQPQSMTIQPQPMTVQPPQVQLSIPQLQVPTASQLMYNSASRMKALEDSFASGRLIPGLRAYRDDGEQAAAAAAAAAQQQEGIPEEALKQSPSEMMEKMKKNDKEDAKNPRVARFIMDKDDAENQLESN